MKLVVGTLFVCEWHIVFHTCYYLRRRHVWQVQGSRLPPIWCHRRLFVSSSTKNNYCCGMTLVGVFIMSSIVLDYVLTPLNYPTGDISFSVFHKLWQPSPEQSINRAHLGCRSALPVTKHKDQIIGPSADVGHLGISGGQGRGLFMN